MRRDRRARGEGAGERASKGGRRVRRRARDAGPGPLPAPDPAPSGPLRPQAPLRSSARLRAPGLRTRVSARPPAPGRPYFSVAPSSAPRRRSQHHVTLAPLFACRGLAGTRLSVRARPFTSTEPALPRSVPSPRLFSQVDGNPHPTSGRHPFTHLCLFFPAYA